MDIFLMNIHSILKCGQMKQKRGIIFMCANGNYLFLSWTHFVQYCDIYVINMNLILFLVGPWDLNTFRSKKWEKKKQVHILEE